MKIRLTGTWPECDQFTTELIAATAPGVVHDVSRFHPNQGDRFGRVYLEVDIPALALAAPAGSSAPPQTPTPSRRTP